MFKSLEENEKITDSKMKELKVYPNPSNGYITVENVSENEQLQIIDLLGKEIPFSLSRSKNEVYIDLLSFKGIAILKTKDHCKRLIIK